MIALFNDAQIARLIDVPSVREEIDAALTSLARQGAAIKPRTRVDCAEVKLSSMGAIWRDAGVAGEKVYPTVAGSFSFLFTLFDIRRNLPLAVMEANELTRCRTPALTTLAAMKAMPYARTAALFGAGLQGRAHAEALAQALPLQQMRVVDMAPVDRWCQEASDRLGIDVRPCSAEQAVRGADIIVTCTRSKQPVFDGRWVRPGAFVAAVGTSLPTGSELDDTLLAAAARVIVEWQPQSNTEAGEVVQGLASGALDAARIVDLPQIYAGEAPWRSHADEIVVFKSVGIGLADLAAAHVAWKRSQAGA